MQKYITILFFSLLVSCTQNSVDMPADIIPEETMILALADMHIADGIVNAKPSAVPDSNIQATVNYRDHIYKKYNLTHDQFNRSFDYYSRHPVQLDSIYSQVVVLLSKKEAEVRGDLNTDSVK